MKYLYLFLISFIIIIVSCQRKINDNDYFNGEIYDIPDKINVTDLYPNKIHLDGNYYGYIDIYDSIILFLNPKLNNSFYEIYNINNGNFLGNYIVKGKGPNEYNGAGEIFQLYIENEELKTLLFAYNNNKLLIWNITKSIDSKTTVYDSIAPFIDRKENLASYRNVSILNKNELIAYLPPTSTSISGRTTTLPYYQRRKLYTDETVEQYTLYKESIEAPETEFFLAAESILKPDGTKMVQAMRYLCQINILDIKSGEFTGYRIENTPDFSVFFKERKSIHRELPMYYIDIQATDDYIFALYAGGKPNLEELPTMVHVYNWDGNLVHKIRLKGEFVANFCFDPVNSKLYTSNQVFSDKEATDNIYCYDLREILK